MFGLIREDYDWRAGYYVPILDSLLIFPRRDQRDRKYETYCETVPKGSRYVRFRLQMCDNRTAVKQCYPVMQDYIYANNHSRGKNENQQQEEDEDNQEQ